MVTPTTLDRNGALVLLHVHQLRRQGDHRPCRGADDARPQPFARAMGHGRQQLLRICFRSRRCSWAFVVNRVPAFWALAAMGLVWALTQFPMLGTTSFAVLIACRVALGAGEGPAYPVAIHAAYKWFPERAPHSAHQHHRDWLRSGRGHRGADPCLGDRGRELARRLRLSRRARNCLGDRLGRIRRRRARSPTRRPPVPPLRSSASLTARCSRAAP